jgi:hypothetical protein
MINCTFAISHCDMPVTKPTRPATGTVAQRTPFACISTACISSALADIRATCDPRTRHDRLGSWIPGSGMTARIRAPLLDLRRHRHAPGGTGSAKSGAWGIPPNGKVQCPRAGFPPLGAGNGGP